MNEKIMSQVLIVTLIIAFTVLTALGKSIPTALIGVGLYLMPSPGQIVRGLAGGKTDGSV